MLPLPAKVSGAPGSQALEFCSTQQKNTILTLTCLQMEAANKARRLQHSIGHPITYAQSGDKKRKLKTSMLCNGSRQDYLSLCCFTYNDIFQNNHQLFLISFLFCVVEHGYPHVQIMNIPVKKKKKRKSIQWLKEVSC